MTGAALPKDPRTLEQQRFLERACLAVVALLATLELAAWLLPDLAAHLPAGWSLMKANTALGMLLGAAGLILMAPRRSPPQQIAGQLLIGTLAMLALLTLLEYGLDQSFGIDTLLAADVSSPRPGRMSPQTAFGLVLLVLTLYCSRARRGAAPLIADGLTLALGAYLLVLFAGYVFGAMHLFGESPQTRVSPQTLLCFALFLAVLIRTRVGSGVFSILAGEGIGSRIARVAAPLAIALPFSLTFLRNFLTTAGLLSGVYASAFSIAIICFSTFGLILLMSWHINTLERRLREALDEESRHKLQESDQRYADLVEQSIFGIIVRTPDHRIVLVNPAFCRITGYTRDELLNMPIEALTESTASESAVTQRIDALRSGESTQVQRRVRRKDGSYTIVEATTSRLLNGNVQSTLTDVSDRERAEEARAQSERRYAELVDQAADGIMVRRGSGEILFVNDAVCGMLGYGRDELMLMSIEDLIDPSDRDSMAQVRDLRPLETRIFERRLRRKDGRTISIETSAHRLENGDIQNIFRDVTERRRAQETLRESELRFRVVVESAPNALLMVDVKGLITLVNAQAEKLFGYPRAELLGRLIDILVPQSVKPRHPELRQRFFSDPGPRYLGDDRNITAVRKDGVNVPVEIGLAPIHTEDGLFALVSVVDISERKRAEQAREASERRYTDLVEQAADSIWIRDAKGEMVYANDASCRLLGYTREELLRTRSSELLHPTDPNTAPQVDRLKPLETLRVERVLRHKDGDPIPVEASLRRLANGEIQVISHDIRERKRAEERFRAMVEGSPTAMLMVSEQGGIAMANPEAEKLFGYQLGELLGQPVEVLVPEPFRSLHPALRAGFHREPRARLMGTGRDLFGLRKDGAKVPVEIGLNPITTAEGRFVLASVIDISERKRAEERFRAMVEGAPNAMLMVNESGAITLVNPQTEKLFGYKREELIGQAIEVLVPQRLRAQHPGLRGGYQRQPQMRAMGVGRDLFGLRKDGTEVPVEIGLNPLETQDGHFVLASIIDISERREAELRDKIYTEELQLMSQRLLDAQETERRAIARELHDEVGQALTAARMNLQELERQTGSGTLAKQAGDTAGIIARLLQQVRQISLNLHPSVLDDLGLVPAIRWTLRERAGSSGLEITLELQEGLPRFITLIEISLYRVFQEALSNVLRHSQAKHLAVTLAHSGERLELCLEDDGRGFEPAAAQKHAREGTSLGVIGMQERVRLAGGEIMIESVPGRGTVVRVSVPATAR